MAAERDERRLDFQYYEHDLAKLAEVVIETYRFVKAFEKETGYAPNGWATYFVNRPEKAKNPTGSTRTGRACRSLSTRSRRTRPNRAGRNSREYNKLAIHKLGGRHRRSRLSGSSVATSDPAQACAAAVHDEIL